MADILLLEPNYQNTYPPLGLMKISYYHKYVKKDYVRFAKGQLPENFKNKKWDRVYVTTLFTYEWKEIKETILYALEVAKSQSSVYVGGIAATLFPESKFRDDEDLKGKPFKIVPGLLNEKGKFDYDDDDKIDRITPDYDILKDVDYKYAYENAYFMYTTRGCGMKCGFCAVQKLEPEYVKRICIRKPIEDIDEKYGPKKDLLLMDNNVLKSPLFHEIVDELKELGFYKGATFKSPTTGKFVKRYVDFNQGLDAFLLSEEKAAKLAELAIKPARIAFDHIEDEDTYRKAIKLCAKNGITELSNYILYNSDAFTGKGHSYKADEPEDLYRRLKITLDLKEEINESRPEEEKISIFSFPMRYIPLQDDRRGYVGEKWNVKYLRAIQRMLIPTQGKGVSSKSFFEADFGASVEEYMETLAMPEDIIAGRGRFEEKKDETPDQRELRRQKWEERNQIRAEWQRLFRGLGTEREAFIEIIKDNSFKTENFVKIKNIEMQKLYLHYFSTSQFLVLLNELDSDKLVQMVYEYCVNEFPLYIKVIAEYINSYQVPYSKLPGYVKVFGKYGLGLVFEHWVKSKYKNEYLIESMSKALDLAKCDFINFYALRTFKSYVDLECLSEKEIKAADKCIIEFDYGSLVSLLKKNFAKFKKALRQSVAGSAGEKELKKQADYIAGEIFEQLSLI